MVFQARSYAVYYPIHPPPHSSNKKIGYTTGVFDLFHIGHLNILSKAKSHCDYLIVGVSTDECAYSYKHKIPTIPYAERKSIVESIKFVDEVVPQNNMDKLDAYQKLKFDILFHGDDWKNSEMYNDIKKKLNLNNVEVCFFPYTSGVSSTIIQKRLENLNNEKI